ncbi:MAG TPA: PIN domain-containing protein [Bryobacteraceae bacterium]|nr:PIN domain-containing protein [Bryobacteraceae bacterium]
MAARFSSASAEVSTPNTEEVVCRPRFQRSEDVIAGLLQTIREKGFWVQPTETVRVSPDPDDNIFLECAQAAQADYLVTGNLKHFPVSWKGTRIIPPRHLVGHHPRQNRKRPGVKAARAAAIRRA